MPLGVTRFLTLSPPRVCQSSLSIKRLQFICQGHTDIVGHQFQSEPFCVTSFSLKWSNFENRSIKHDIFPSTTHIPTCPIILIFTCPWYAMVFSILLFYSTTWKAVDKQYNIFVAFALSTTSYQGFYPGLLCPREENIHCKRGRETFFLFLQNKYSKVL